MPLTRGSAVSDGCGRSAIGRAGRQGPKARASLVRALAPVRKAGAPALTATDAWVSGGLGPCPFSGAQRGVRNARWPGLVVVGAAGAADWDLTLHPQGDPRSQHGVPREEPLLDQ